MSRSVFADPRLPRSERFALCRRCARVVGLRADGTKRTHGTNASPPECRSGGDAPSAGELLR